MSAAGTLTAFERATAVRALGDGAWRAECEPGWSTPRGPNGGYLAAIVARAMTEAVADATRHARSLTLHYLRPPADGELRVETAVERSGRSLSTVSARMLQDGRPCVLAIGAFAVDLPSVLDYAGAPPEAAAPETLDPLPWVPGIPRMFQHLEMRPALGPAPFSTAGEARTGGWLRLREPQGLDAPTLALYADAWIPAPYTRLPGPLGAPTVDLTIHFRAPAAAAALPSDEPLLANVHSSTSAGGFFEENGELWSRDGVLLAHSRQLALLLGAEQAGA